MVVLTIVAEIINTGMIWRRLFAFIQPFKPSAPRQVVGLTMCRSNTYFTFLRNADSRKRPTWQMSAWVLQGRRPRFLPVGEPIRVFRTFPQSGVWRRIAPLLKMLNYARRVTMCSERCE